MLNVRNDCITQWRKTIHIKQSIGSKRLYRVIHRLDMDYEESAFQQRRYWRSAFLLPMECIPHTSCHLSSELPLAWWHLSVPSDRQPPHQQRRRPWHLIGWQMQTNVNEHNDNIITVNDTVHQSHLMNIPVNLLLTCKIFNTGDSVA